MSLLEGLKLNSRSKEVYMAIGEKGNPCLETLCKMMASFKDVA
jgi:hypothetical protein